LSGHLRNLAQVAPTYQTVYYPDDAADAPHAKNTRVKRYPLTLPFYPFRTLSPRELMLHKIAPSEFDAASPLFPAHTQLNITLKRRTGTNFLNYMLPQNLNILRGNASGSLTAAERQTATSFTLPNVDPAQPAVQYVIKRVTVELKDVYLQVRIPLPLAHRSVFLAPPSR
jgi:hypothetical protein